MAEQKPMSGRPFKWPWLDTKVGGSFVISCHTIQSCRSQVSRISRLYGVRYSIHKHPDQYKFRLRRVK